MSHDSSADGRETIVTVDEVLHESRREIADRKPTGRQIIEAAGKHPPDECFVLYRPEIGGLRELQEDETIEIGPHGTSRFYLVNGDRLFRFEIDGLQYEWPIDPISGTVLPWQERIPKRRLCGRKMAKRPPGSFQPKKPSVSTSRALRGSCSSPANRSIRRSSSTIRRM